MFGVGGMQDFQPSVHLWVPTTSQGLPIVEGIFDQVTVGETAVFSGAEPSRVPARWQQRLAQEAAWLGLLFQRLGYYGRCSFDSILVGRNYERATLHWVECNGRWGGVSIPMTLANRLLGDWRTAWPVIIEGYTMAKPARGLGAVLTDLSDKHSTITKASAKEPSYSLLAVLKRRKGMRSLCLPPPPRPPVLRPRT